jgi:hypothetical protein
VGFQWRGPADLGAPVRRLGDGDASDHERFELVTPSLADSMAAVAGITHGGPTPVAATASLNAVTVKRLRGLQQ